MEPLKLGIGIVVLAAGWFGGWLALRRAAGAPTGRFLSLGNAFAAGVFLGAGFIHMLADAARRWQELGSGYPTGMLLAAVAFLVMLLFEHVLIPEAGHQLLHAPSGEPFPATGEHRHAHGHSRDRGALSRIHPLAAYAIVAALSVHSVIAGLALGAESEVARALVIFLAILAHKSIAGFALGVSLRANGMPRRRAYGLLGIFACATPLGILAGSLLGGLVSSSARDLLEATALALAAGTFIYVATVDILRDELLEPGGLFAKWSMLSAGVASMALLALWV